GLFFKLLRLALSRASLKPMRLPASRNGPPAVSCGGFAVGWISGSHCRSRRDDGKAPVRLVLSPPCADRRVVVTECQPEVLLLGESPLPGLAPAGLTRPRSRDSGRSPRPDVTILTPRPGERADVVALRCGGGQCGREVDAVIVGSQHRCGAS